MICYRGVGAIQKGHYTKVAFFGPFFACFLSDLFWEQMWLTNSKLDFWKLERISFLSFFERKMKAKMDFELLYSPYTPVAGFPK